MAYLFSSNFMKEDEKYFNLNCVSLKNVDLSKNYRLSKINSLK